MVNILKNKLPPNFIKMSASNEKSRKKQELEVIPRAQNKSPLPSPTEQAKPSAGVLAPTESTPGLHATQRNDKKSLIRMTYRLYKHFKIQAKQPWDAIELQFLLNGNRGQKLFYDNKKCLYEFQLFLFLVESKLEDSFERGKGEMNE